jgi:hypothetical protein
VTASLARGKATPTQKKPSAARAAGHKARRIVPTGTCPSQRSSTSASTISMAGVTGSKTSVIDSITSAPTSSLALGVTRCRGESSSE